MNNITNICRVRDALRQVLRSDLITYEEVIKLNNIHKRIKEQLTELEDGNHTILR